MRVAHLEGLTSIGGTTEPTFAAVIAPKPATCYFAALQEA
jgi:hypothetical protein